MLLLLTLQLGVPADRFFSNDVASVNSLSLPAPRLKQYSAEHAAKIAQLTGERLTSHVIDEEWAPWCVRGEADSRDALALGADSFPTRRGSILRSSNGSAIQLRTAFDPDGFEPDVSSTVDEAKQRHRWQRSIVWLHVHKNAGTSLCMLARDQSEAIFPISMYNDGKGLPSGNCNLCGDNCNPPFAFTRGAPGKGMRKYNDCVPLDEPALEGFPSLEDGELTFHQVRTVSRTFAHLRAPSPAVARPRAPSRACHPLRSPSLPLARLLSPSLTFRQEWTFWSWWLDDREIEHAPHACMHVCIASRAWHAHCPSTQVAQLPQVVRAAARRGEAALLHGARAVDGRRDVRRPHLRHGA